jgi:prolyl-tRNA synthetase
MVIRPYGFALWENMRDRLDAMIKETGHVNAYFPTLIPESFMKKEAEHVEGFAPECAVVTHGGGKKLEEPLVLRPTSETIIYHMYAKWVMSYRDLPILINQWANVFRWEMRPRLFLRTLEFLWQEGHTAHATYEEAEEETLKMLEVYRVFAEETLAIPVYPGVKSDSERFAGALRTYCIEAMMQDGKALQAGTSHNLGQNFAKAFDLKFQDKDGETRFAWNTSWGVSTRLVGAVVMQHGDDNGLILPPRIAPIQVVIVPIYSSDDDRAAVLEAAENIRKSLTPAVRVRIDSRDQYKPGWKFAEWEQKGVPLRVEIGPKDVAKAQVMIARRDTREKQAIPIEGAASLIAAKLEEIQAALFARAKKFRDEHTFLANDYDELKAIVEKGGFAFAHWDGTRETEALIKEETKATIRCIPLHGEMESGRCVRSGNPSAQRVYFARAY